MDGDGFSPEGLYPLLRRIAAARMRGERRGDSLGPTGLVHEAWLRFAGEPASVALSRAEYLRAAAVAMRRILVERARRRDRLRHGGAFERSTEGALASVAAETQGEAGRIELLALDEALEKLAVEEPRAAEVARLRLFAEATEEDVVEALTLSASTVRRDWRYAKAFLAAELQLDRRAR
jgi:RNA polymerase sigma factor (TIGR02999 family)